MTESRRSGIRRSTRPRRWATFAFKATKVVACGLALAVVAAVLARREVAGVLVREWLASNGVDAEVWIEDLSFDRASLSIRLGPQTAPDLAVDGVEVELELGWPWSPGGTGLHPTRVTLSRPLQRAHLSAGGLRLGAVDDLLRALAGGGRAEQAAPMVRVEDGTVLLETGGGIVELRGDAIVEADQRLRATATIRPTRVDAGRLAAEIGGGSLEVSTAGDATRVLLAVDFDRMSLPGTTLERVRATLGGVVTRQGGLEGALTLGAKLMVGRMKSAERSADDVALALSFVGHSHGGLLAPNVRGTALLGAEASTLITTGLEGRDVTAAAALPDVQLAEGHARAMGWAALGSTSSRVGTTTAGDLRAEASGLDLHGTLGEELRASFDLVATADRIRGETVGLDAVRIDASSRFRWAETLQGEIVGALESGGGAWHSFGPIGGGDDERSRALEEALADFSVSAPQLGLTLDGPNVDLRLEDPVRIAPASGGVVVLSSRRGEPVYAGAGGLGRGAFNLTASGGALPDLAIVVPRFTLRNDEAWVFEGDAAGTVVVSTGPLHAGAFRGEGSVFASGGSLRFSSSRCLTVGIERLGRGTAELRNLDGAWCPDGRPLFRKEGEDWQVAGWLTQAQGEMPGLDARFQEAEGRVRASGGSSSQALRLDIEGLELIDTEQRVRPLRVAGRLTRARRRWKGSFDLFARDLPIGQVDLRHDEGTGSGALELDARGVAFEPSFLQPADLFPDVEQIIISSAEGVVDLTGRVDWDRKGSTSRGRVRSAGLDFDSPAGRVVGLRGDIELSSLTPLTTAPQQTLTITRVGGPVEIADIRAALTLTEDVLEVEEGKLSILEGRARVGPLAIPLAGNKRWQGSVHFADVQLEPLIEMTSVADRIHLRAAVDGVLPFSVGPEGVRIAGGRIVGTESGRLSIDPSVLSGAAGLEVRASEAEGAGALAQQALQHLAFQRLHGLVSSLPGGKIGLKLAIQGRHDPPEKQKMKLRWLDVLRGRWRDDLKLPSGTEIDLSLDMRVNLGELLGSLVATAAPLLPDPTPHHEPGHPSR